MTSNDCQTANGEVDIFFHIYDTPSRYLETAILVHSVSNAHLPSKSSWPNKSDGGLGYVPGARWNVAAYREVPLSTKQPSTWIRLRDQPTVYAGFPFVSKHFLDSSPFKYPSVLEFDKIHVAMVQNDWNPQTIHLPGEMELTVKENW